MDDIGSRKRVRPGRTPRLFLRDDDGAVTVDWVVLTAAIGLFGAAIVITVSANLPVIADEIAEVTSSRPVGID